MPGFSYAVERAAVFQVEFLRKPFTLAELLASVERGGAAAACQEPA